MFIDKYMSMVFGNFGFISNVRYNNAALAEDHQPDTQPLRE